MSRRPSNELRETMAEVEPVTAGGNQENNFFANWMAPVQRKPPEYLSQPDSGAMTRL